VTGETGEREEREPSPVPALSQARHIYGRTALLLSGGAGLGMFHFGVVRELRRHGLLPRILSGASAGSIVAAIVCSRTPQQLDELLAGGAEGMARELDLRFFDEKGLFAGDFLAPFGGARAAPLGLRFFDEGVHCTGPWYRGRALYRPVVRAALECTRNDQRAHRRATAGLPRPRGHDLSQVAGQGCLARASLQRGTEASDPSHSRAERKRATLLTVERSGSERPLASTPS
jgi:hypothetical protein